MSRRKWFSVYGKGPALHPHDSPVELARVVSEGLAQLVAYWLRETGYTDVSVR